MSELHNWDNIDVPVAKGRDAQDGPGVEEETELPPSDFVQEDEDDK